MLAAPPQPLVRFRNVHKSYPGGAAAVRNLSLEVAAGEFLTILGPSGAGKTTILMLLAGFERPDLGEILLEGRPIGRTPPHRRGIGVVFQDASLFPHLTVAGNVAFPLGVRGMARAEQQDRVARALDMVRLAGLEERLPTQLSGGQQQRVALARALVFGPRLVLLDEPLGALDRQLREQVQLEIRHLHERLGVTMIYVTHDQAEAMTMGDRICIMNAGQVVQTGAPLEVYRNPVNAFVARFLGSPPMNLLPARLEPAGDHARVHVAGASLDLPDWPLAAVRAHLNREVTLGVRPEDLYENPPAPMPRLQVKVRAIEALGAETILLLAAGEQNHELLARVGRETGFRIGEQAQIAIDVAAIHLFDVETGAAISRR